MSGVTRPSGPLPARVYWVRRGLVLATAFALVFALARLLGGGSDGSSGAEQAERTAAQPTSEVDTSPGAEQKPSAEKTTKKTRKIKKTLPAPDGDCLPEEVRVSPEIRSEPAGADQIPIPITLTTDREACVFDFSASTVVLKITSGNDNIWSSQHCPVVLGEHSTVVRSIRPVTLTVNWNGKRSDEECSPNAGWAYRGGYHAIAATLGGEPVDQYFELTKAERKVIKKVREPKKKNKNKSKRSAGAEASAGASPSAD